MQIVRQIISIFAVSFIVGLIFNAFSPRGISIFNNPWAKKTVAASVSKIEQNHQHMQQEEPIIFVNFDRTCLFIEGQEGIVLDARTPEDFAEGHIPGAYLLFFYNMNEYYPQLEGQLEAATAILVYCSDSDCDDSEFLANELFNLGYEPILVYRDGFEGWKEHQMPIEKGRKEVQG